MEPTRSEFLDLSQPERYLFYFLIYLAIGFMVYQIWQRSRIWLKGKPIEWSSKPAAPVDGSEAKPKFGIPALQDLKRWVKKLQAL